MRKMGKGTRAAAGLMALVLAAVQPVAVFAEESGGPGVAAETETASEEPLEATEEEIDAYFDGSVFVGDSVMLGFRNYAQARPGTYLDKMQFLAAGSFSTFNALKPVTSSSTHPVYQGQRRLIWESIAMMQAKRVFLFFGLNDLGIGGVEGTCARYAEVVSRIRAMSPEAEIHIISMTYTLTGRGKGALNNDNIRLLNLRLQQMALENGWGYVALADVLADASGGLAPQYCSDHYVHQTRAAYDVWSLVLRQYAKDQLEGVGWAAMLAERASQTTEDESDSAAAEESAASEEGQAVAEESAASEEGQADTEESVASEG